ncbi:MULTISPECIES: AMP-dependent synthetase/ligase [Paenarthrobacter]|uniref:AMP-dependent synthetase/ligase n=1 Tax=Paenarthrobacter TaxID=1742992 RepID=UPI00037F4F1B|nr:long-chain fatty acid--CoA ligase [Paenarthrobacter nicotinovorans]MBP2392986.1 long-chain acyl-CoA synthetase [Paenarthrobacter nicotinovorans]UKF00726.1 long-chain fatty acid--CoA ligase [Paenarthrobacter nicotinovorans]UKF05507.1 long-chain fatty acid--CoA ligase [Paenarthrobacter nicotinovorans]GGV29507.1 long-chain acyl-CoA synthetase [Paenarthrobacter nicotinovorans]
MREISVPPLVNISPETNITDLVLREAGKASNPPLFSKLDASGQWADIRATDFLADVRALAKGLIASGVGQGDRVGIMSRTRYEWSLVDFAIWFAGAVSVPIYETSSPSQVAWNLGDSGAVAAFGESAHHEDIIRQAVVAEDITSVANVWQLEGAGLDALRTAGAGVPDDELESRRSAAGLRDIATIIYTSGTTGRPKGCELTHGNFVELSENARASLPEIINESGKTIMFLPLAHVFARFISVLAVAGGVKVAHTPDIKNLLGDLQSFQPTFILAVPRVFEKVYNSALTKAEDGGKGAIFHRAVDTAIAYSKARQDGNLGLGLKIKHAVFDKLVYGKLRAAMGGHVAHAVSGGGPLGERLGHFFQGIGLQILEGYGLTETTAPISVNTPSMIRIGSVGAPLPGNAVKIADDGEILAKGVCVMRGYYKRPDLTEETFTADGWFRTGDIGELDSNGFLKITGRKKEIIVTAGGKNVVPALLEDQIRADALVSQVLVVGDNRPFIGALVTLDEEALPGWLERHGLPAGTTLAEATENAVVKAAVQELISKANQSVSQAEAIKAFRVVPADFTEASGHLTPSLKVKRAQVMKDFDAVIEEMYSAPRAS